MPRRPEQQQPAQQPATPPSPPQPGEQPRSPLQPRPPQQPPPAVPRPSHEAEQPRPMQPLPHEPTDQAGDQPDTAEGVVCGDLLDWLDSAETAAAGHPFELLALQFTRALVTAACSGAPLPQPEHFLHQWATGAGGQRPDRGQA